MEIALFSVVVAATSVIVGAVMQYLTLRLSRRNTISSLRVNAAETAITNLKNTLAEYIPVAYTIAEEFVRNRRLRERLVEFSDDPKIDERRKQLEESEKLLTQLRLQEAKLFAVIEPSVISQVASHEKLVDALRVLREHDFSSYEGPIWLEKRAVAIKAANELIGREREQAIIGDS